VLISAAIGEHLMRTGRLLKSSTSASALHVSTLPEHEILPDVFLKCKCCVCTCVHVCMWVCVFRVSQNVASWKVCDGPSLWHEDKVRFCEVIVCCCGRWNSILVDTYIDLSSLTFYDWFVYITAAWAHAFPSSSFCYFCKKLLLLTLG
jgi:hypothetical protein